MTQYNVSYGSQGCGKTAMSEMQLQARCFQWAHNTYPQIRKLLYAVPNGGTRHKMEAMTLKATGVTKGIPDLVLLWNGRQYGFELKVDNNTQSVDQKEVEKKWMQHGAEYHLVRDEETFKSLIKSIIS